MEICCSLCCQLYFSWEYHNSRQNIIILFWQYLVDIWSKTWQNLFWEYINGKLFAMLIPSFLRLILLTIFTTLSLVKRAGITFIHLRTRKMRTEEHKTHWINNVPKILIFLVLLVFFLGLYSTEKQILDYVTRMWYRVQ